MNINAKLLELEDLTGLEVEEDDYSGDKDEYIVFTYADERYTEYGDDIPIAETADVMLKCVLKKSRNYFAMKEDIKKFLVEAGAYQITSNSYCEVTADKKVYRNLIIEFKMTQEV